MKVDFMLFIQNPGCYMLFFNLIRQLN